jgi:hypothetical protein
MPERIHIYFSFDEEILLPEKGVADFQGSPHYFWLVEGLSEPSTGVFELVPIDQEVFGLVNEVESIWHDWDAAYHAGMVGLETHPWRAGNNPRFVEMVSKIELRASALRDQAESAIGIVNASQAYLDHMRQFEGRKWPLPGAYSPVLEVTWREEPSDVDRVVEK